MSDSVEASHSIGGRPGWLTRLEQVDRHITSKVERVVRDLEDLAVAAEEEAVSQLLTATARIDGEKMQSDILLALLEEGRRFAARTAFFLTRPGEVRGWSGRGFGEGVAVETLQLDFDDEGVWARLARASGTLTLDSEGCSSICDQLGAEAGSQGVLIPFILRGQLGGVLYADRLPGEGAPARASLQLLTHSAAQAIETAALRGASVSPTLRVASDQSGETVVLWQPPEVATADVAEMAEESEAGGDASIGSVVAGAAVAGAATATAELTEEETSAESEEEVIAESAEAPEPEDYPGDVVEAVEAEELVDVEPATSEVTVDEHNLEEPRTAAAPASDEEARGEDVAAEEAEPADAGIDFEMVPEAETEVASEEFAGQELEAVDDISDDLEPEPELEDSSSDLWAADAAGLDPPPVVESEEPPAAPASFVSPHSPMPSSIPGVGQETVRLDIAALQGQGPAAGTPTAGAPESMAPSTEVTPPAEVATSAEVEQPEEEHTAKLPRWEVESTPAAETAAPGYDLEPEVSEPVTEPMASPSFGTATDPSEDPTIMTSRENLIPEPAAPEPSSPMAGGYVPPAPSSEVKPPPSSGFAAPPPKQDGTGSTQVVPPTDIQGPGSAFGATGEIPEGDAALHEEARRLARLLVSEIKLYNEEIIEEGRRAGNIYERLKDDIDRSRQMYEERIDPRLKDSGNDYFHQELVQRLAGGDTQLLGY